MIFAAIMLALYGLSCLISSLVLWLSVEKSQEGDFLIVPVASQTLVRAKIGASIERLKNSGMGHIAGIIVVDCGLPEIKIHIVEEYCKKKRIAFCKRDELPNYLKNSPFQKIEDTV